MPATYESIATTTLTSTSSSISFTSISSSYTDLRLVILGQIAQNGPMPVTVNNDGSSIYGYIMMENYGGTNLQNGYSPSNTYAFAESDNFNGTGDTVGATIYDFYNYAATNVWKVIKSRYGRNLYAGEALNTWRSTAAISTITIGVVGVTHYLAGTTASLYGITRA